MQIYGLLIDIAISIKNTIFFFTVLKQERLLIMILNSPILSKFPLFHIM